MSDKLVSAEDRRAPDGDTTGTESCEVCGKRASHEYTPPLFPGRLLLCNDCNPTHSPTIDRSAR